MIIFHRNQLLIFDGNSILKSITGIFLRLRMILRTEKRIFNSNIKLAIETTLPVTVRHK